MRDVDDVGVDFYFPFSFEFRISGLGWHFHGLEWLIGLGLTM